MGFMARVCGSGLRVVGARSVRFVGGGLIMVEVEEVECGMGLRVVLALT
jgi:hypothetical protein